MAQLRARIREAGEEVPDRERHELWRDARDEIEAVRHFGDLAIAAFFAEAKPRQREAKRREFADAVVNGEAVRYLSWLEGQRDGNPPLAPFHWEIEFPEVFDRENPGFDAFVGNPPFAGKNALAGGNVAHYPDWLKAAHEESHGNADLVAHFYRRAFNLVRSGGALGLIATNTIAQGDTRSTGLRWICEHGGEIYRAIKREKWPGEAAVVVSVLHIAKGRYEGSKVLDGTKVDTITAFLFHRGGHADPVRLEANAEQELPVGSYRPRDGLHLRRHRQEGRRITPGRNATAGRGGSAQRGSHLPLHRRGGGEHEPHPCPPPLRDQLPGLPAATGRSRATRGRGRTRHSAGKWLRKAIVPLDYPEPVAADWPEPC